MFKKIIMFLVIIAGIYVKSVCAETWKCKSDDAEISFNTLTKECSTTSSDSDRLMRGIYMTDGDYKLCKFKKPDQQIPLPVYYIFKTKINSIKMIAGGIDYDEFKNYIQEKTGVPGFLMNIAIKNFFQKDIKVETIGSNTYLIFIGDQPPVVKCEVN